MPASVFANIATIEAFYITLPAAAEAQIGVTELHFAKLAYYTTNPTNANEFATQMITLTDFSTWTEEWFAGRITDVNGVDVQLCKRPSYTVTEIVDGVQTNKTVQQGESYAPVAPTKENAAFIGWKYTDASNTTGEIKTSSFTVTSDCTVEALFVEFEKLGVSIKTSGTQGLRFKNQVKAESVALLEELGLTATYGTKLTHDTLGTQHIATENWLDVDNKVFAAVLTFNGVENVESYYDDVFTATAYVEINGVKYYANATQSASLAYVANLAVNDSNTNYSEAERNYLATIAAYYQA